MANNNNNKNGLKKKAVKVGEAIVKKAVPVIKAGVKQLAKGAKEVRRTPDVSGVGRQLILQNGTFKTTTATSTLFEREKDKESLFGVNHAKKRRELLGV